MVVKGKKLTLKEQWQKLLDELKPMTPKQRMEHLWEYYKWVLGVLLAVACLVSIVVTGIINANMETLVEGITLNCKIDDPGCIYLTDGYMAKRGGVPGEQQVGLALRTFENPATSEDPEFNYNVYQSITAMIAASALDYLMMDQTSMELILHPEVMLDLRELFTEEELKAMDDRVIKLVNEETGEIVPMALDISDSEFYREYMSQQKGKVYLAFAVTTPRKEACRDIWEYITTLYRPEA
jgi:predicted outer membrane lipoprotein